MGYFPFFLLSDILIVEKLLFETYVSQGSFKPLIVEYLIP